MEELTSKQRAQLRGLANSIDTILIVGKVVQVIGTKFVLYRPSHKKDKKDKIVLVEGKKKRP